MCSPFGALGMVKPVARMIDKNPAWAMAPGLGLVLGKGKKAPPKPTAPVTGAIQPLGVSA